MLSHIYMKIDFVIDHFVTKCCKASLGGRPSATLDSGPKSVIFLTIRPHHTVVRLCVVKKLRCVPKTTTGFFFGTRRYF